MFDLKARATHCPKYRVSGRSEEVVDDDGR